MLTLEITGSAWLARRGTVKLGNTATTAATASAIGKAPVLSREAFLELYHKQATLAGKATNLIRDALPAISRTTTGANLVDLSKTLDARLALGSMVIQVIGIWNGFDALSKAGSGSARLDATYGLLDSVVGFSGGALQMGTVFAEIRLTRKV